MQYLGSGSTDGRDNMGNPTSSFSSSFAAYSLAYGHQISDGLSLGMTGGKPSLESITRRFRQSLCGGFRRAL